MTTNPETPTITKRDPEPGSLAWHLERGDKAGAARQLVEARRWLTELRVELETEIEAVKR